MALESAQQQEHSQPTLIDEMRQADPKFNAEFTAACFVLDVHVLVQNAFNRSGETHESLAEKMGVDGDRVRELLSKEGIMYTSSLARMMAAMGYTLEFTVMKETFDANGNIDCEEVDLTTPIRVRQE